MKMGVPINILILKDIYSGDFLAAGIGNKYRDASQQQGCPDKHIDFKRYNGIGTHPSSVSVLIKVYLSGQ